MPINRHLIYALKATCSKPVLAWLNWQASLTDRLRELTGEAEVQLLKQQWLNTDFWARSMLSIKDTMVFQREILMKSQGISYWYARSIIPKSCYDLEADFFQRLNEESIRNLIFDEPKVERINSVNYVIDQQCVEYYWVKKYIPNLPTPLWVRLAEYSFLGRESLYLLEVMLPEVGELY
ncbi:MAG: 4-hydroxybenzoate synthetase [Legionella sp. 40-6]|nr:chorismate lyase [Legionella sp.]OJY17312.1 MAG: 4-hydroxybenzoate synthetase [Legionella sp. 40-6]